MAAQSAPDESWLPEEIQAGGIPRRRIQSLSDLIFGLALSISALTLIGHQPTTVQQFYLALGLYAFSFLILITVWRMYSRIATALPVDTGATAQLNIVLLFCVSITPYLFNELFASSGDLAQAITAAFGYDQAAMFLILSFFAWTLADEERKLVPRELLARYRFERTRTLVVGLVFVVSVLPYFGQPVFFSITSGGSTTTITVREAIWFFALAVSFVTRLFTPKANAPHDPTSSASSPESQTKPS